MGNKPNVRRIERTVMPEFTRVAAYARVSKDTPELMHSLSAQISYYSSLIQNTPGWIYEGVYVDAGITGTNAAARPEFQRMLRDAENGQFKILLTKSISRFARNTVDLLTTIRRFKELGIDVRFEREHISTMSGDGEVMLSILASFAENESVSLSQARLAKLKAERDERLARSRKIEGFIDEMLNAPLVLTEWQDQLWNMLVQKAVISADGTVAFTFKGEKTVTVRVE